MKWIVVALSLVFLPVAVLAEPTPEGSALRKIAEEVAPFVRASLPDNGRLDLDALDFQQVSRKELRRIHATRAREKGLEAPGILSRTLGALTGWAYSFGIGAAFVPANEANKDRLVFVREMMRGLSDAQIKQMVGHELVHAAQRQSHAEWFSRWTDGATRRLLDARTREQKADAWVDLLAGRIAIEGQARHVESTLGNIHRAGSIRIPWLARTMARTSTLFSRQALQMAATYDVAAQASPSQLAAFIGNDDAMRQHVVPVARRMHEKLTPARFLKQKLTNFGHRARAALPNKAR